MAWAIPWEQPIELHPIAIITASIAVCYWASPFTTVFGYPMLRKRLLRLIRAWFPRYTDQWNLLSTLSITTQVLVLVLVVAVQFPAYYVIGYWPVMNLSEMVDPGPLEPEETLLGSTVLWWTRLLQLALILWGSTMMGIFLMRLNQIRS